MPNTPTIGGSFKVYLKENFDKYDQGDTYDGSGESDGYLQRPELDKAISDFHRILVKDNQFTPKLRDNFKDLEFHSPLYREAVDLTWSFHLFSEDGISLKDIDDKWFPELVDESIDTIRLTDTWKHDEPKWDNLAGIRES